MKVRAFLVLCAAWATVCVAGCASEERVIYNRPMFGALPNAQVGQPVTMPKGYQNIVLKPREQVDPNDPEKKQVAAGNGRQLMVNIYNSLAKQDRTTFVNDILSQQARDSLTQSGRDPGSAFDELYEKSDELVELFNRIPMGEYTPGIYMEKIGAGVFRVKLYGPTARGLYFTGFDMQLENSSWRLVRMLVD